MSLLCTIITLGSKSDGIQTVFRGFQTWIFRPIQKQGLLCRVVQILHKLSIVSFFLLLERNKDQ